MRTGRIERNTAETKIFVEVDLDGTGTYDIATGVGFLDHMVEQFSRHSLIDVTLKVDGDLHVDQHHTTEDSALALGQALSQALGDKGGIARYGTAYSPMDETLAVAAVDLSGRPHAVIDLKLRVRRVGDLQSELIHDFFDGFASAARANVHATVLYGRSSHHHVEAVFKAFARARSVGDSADQAFARMVGRL